MEAAARAVAQTNSSAADGPKRAASSLNGSTHTGSRQAGLGQAGLGQAGPSQAGSSSAGSSRAGSSLQILRRGLLGWLLARFERHRKADARLSVIERIALAPRQSLVLIEAEGRRLLVATSQDGPAAFYPLEDRHTPAAPEPARAAVRSARW